MMLGEIRNYLRQRNIATLSDVANHFDIAPDTARFALNYWQNKGRIRQQSAGCGSGGCGAACGNSGGSDRYEWINREQPLRWLPARKRTG